MATEPIQLPLASNLQPPLQLFSPLQRPSLRPLAFLAPFTADFTLQRSLLLPSAVGVEASRRRSPRW